MPTDDPAKRQPIATVPEMRPVPDAPGFYRPDFTDRAVIDPAAREQRLAELTPDRRRPREVPSLTVGRNGERQAIETITPEDPALHAEVATIYEAICRRIDDEARRSPGQDFSHSIVLVIMRAIRTGCADVVQARHLEDELVAERVAAASASPMAAGHVEYLAGVLKARGYPTEAAALAAYVVDILRETGRL